MKTFTILYRWQGKEYKAAFPGRDERAARVVAAVQLMNGASVYGAIEGTVSR
jgi:hypothetical protein